MRRGGGWRLALQMRDGVDRGAVEARRALAAPEHQHGEGRSGILRGDPEELPPHGHARQLAAPGAEEGGGSGVAQQHPAGGRGGEPVRQAGKGVRLHQDEGHFGQDAGQRERPRRVTAEAQRGRRPALAHDPQGDSESARHRQQRGEAAAEGDAVEGPDRDVQQLESGLRHEAVLEAASGADEDALPPALAQLLPHLDAGDHMPAGPGGSDQRAPRSGDSCGHRPNLLMLSNTPEHASTVISDEPP